MTRTVVLDETDVSTVLARDPSLGRAACEDAFRYVEAGQVMAPVKQYVRLPGAHTADRLISMPVRVLSPPLVGIKWIGSAAENWRTGLPRATAVIVLNDPVTHVPRAILSGGQISTERTAWAAILAAKAARPDAATVGILGMGRLGSRLVELIGGVLPHIDRIGYVSAAEPPSVPGLATVRYESAPQLARESELLFACTISDAPYLGVGDVAGEGCIVSLSLMDFAAEVIADSHEIVVDDLEACRHAPKVFAQAWSQGRLSGRDIRSLGSMLARPAATAPGRCFVNLVGMGVQDLVLADRVLGAHRGECPALAL